MKPSALNPILLIIILIPLTISCSPKKIETKLIRSLERNCPGDTCTVNLSDLTDFDWEKMYLFDDWASPEKISAATGIDYKKGGQFPNGFRKMIFLNARKIVHEEEYGDNGNEKSSISIGYPIDLSSYSELTRGYSNTNSFITRDQAIYHVKKSKKKGSCNSCYRYELMPQVNSGKILIY